MTVLSLSTSSGDGQLMTDSPTRATHLASPRASTVALSGTRSAMPRGMVSVPAQCSAAAAAYGWPWVWAVRRQFHTPRVVWGIR
jgi:hypothetical protein